MVRYLSLPRLEPMAPKMLQRLQSIYKTPVVEIPFNNGSNNSDKIEPKPKDIDTLPIPIHATVNNTILKFVF